MLLWHQCFRFSFFDTAGFWLGKKKKKKVEVEMTLSPGRGKDEATGETESERQESSFDATFTAARCKQARQLL